MPNPNNALETCIRDIKDVVEVVTGRTLTKIPLACIRALLIKFRVESENERDKN